MQNRKPKQPWFMRKCGTCEIERDIRRLKEADGIYLCPRDPSHLGFDKLEAAVDKARRRQPAS